MKRRRFCLASFLLVVLAIVVHFGALETWSKSLRIRVRTVSAAPEQKTVLRAEADRMKARGSVLAVVGMCLATASAACYFVSVRRHEPPAWWRSVHIAMLVFYVMLFFVMI